ncbi:MAG TPA: tetratricopeptide repeat protein [Edaphobacter sp.]|nr:tetratricopeptide repeat protein [Edaphobacter sp.]
MKRPSQAWLLLGVLWVVVSGTAVLSAQDGSPQSALALEQQGQNAEAEQAWQSVARSNPQNAEAFAHLGLIEARRERYDEAIANYRKALALNPALPGLQMNLGLALFKAKDFKDSIKPFTAELNKHPDDQRLTILLGMAHYGMGDYFVAIPYLRKAAERDPQSLPLRLALAHSCLWSKQNQCVLDVYKQILALNAESAEADMLAGEALDETGDTAGATEQFRAAVRSNPKEPNVHFGLGYLLWAQNHFSEAATEFQAELDNDPKHLQARDYLGDSYVHLNDYAKALPELEKAVGADPSFALVHLDLGIVYVEDGRKDDAIKELQKAIALDPKDVAPHWRLAKLYQSMGRKEDAKAEFAKASTMDKESLQASHALYEKLLEAQRTPQK